MTVVRVVAPHFVAGLVLNSRTAPIIRYMRNWTLRRIADYCKRKRWTFEVLP